MHSAEPDQPAGGASRAEPGGRRLDGRTVAVTASRRREELVTLLERSGATVVGAPTMRTVPLLEDSTLSEATRACLDNPADVAIVTTASGLRGWLEAAGRWGVREQLLRRLDGCRLVCRGPKSKGAVRAAGLTEQWSPESEASGEVLNHLLADGVAGQRVAVQLHGDPFLEFTAALRSAGADVIEVPVYRWELPDDVEPVRELVRTLAGGHADAAVFTSAPAVNGLLRVAEDIGSTEAVLEAFRTQVIPACVGPVTAAPLEQRGVVTRQPHRARVAPLVAMVAEALA